MATSSVAVFFIPTLCFTTEDAGFINDFRAPEKEPAPLGSPRRQFTRSLPSSPEKTVRPALLTALVPLKPRAPFPGHCSVTSFEWLRGQDSFGVVDEVFYLLSQVPQGECGGLCRVECTEDRAKEFNRAQLRSVRDLGLEISLIEDPVTQVDKVTQVTIEQFLTFNVPVPEEG